ncbi:PREDICTED: pleckstrin homology domain-containing family A member 8-like [Amphimedon queenslandica]|uniref:Pleckstrin homology domain-containing family A member 8 n=1 Tax=Amphimedon queenslandica TaxID=400682 RepID=A0A1X7UFD0_AMPQE|nr:PREDICTED: pleckstrin homology domain-containing family A member 8-like [Amphimedon queenslandica]|eukprot:XP_003388130.1 PREDICTED: pleckstrin homology domain-containing family A member 8-like [Amphimedon queenslandica]
MSTYLEGTLNKWTNYYSGWQPRWFILDGGVLSYYLSSMDVQQGSKGSVKISSCDIIAHHKDNRRIDLVIKNGMHMYLKASSKIERQKWLVAFGSTKQEDLSLERSSLKHGDIIKSRMVDLHVSCQTLVTHIASLKTCLREANSFSDKKLDEVSDALSTTCDEFLNALAECMDLSYSEEQWPEHIKPLSSKQLATPSPTLSRSVKFGRTGSPVVHTSSNSFSADELYLSSSTPPPRPPHPVSPLRNTQDTSSLPFHLQKPQKQIVAQSSASLRDASRSSSELFLTPTSSPVPSPPSSPLPEVATIDYDTFFSKLPHKFVDISLDEDEGIPTDSFLQCCSDLLPFFDALSPTAFAPVKADISGNIEKIRRKYNENPTLYHTLQGIVGHEVNTQTHTVKNSSTDALLWLKRAIEFVQVFIFEVANGEENLGAAASVAYTKSLKQHHNWLVRGIFNLAVKAVPYYADFLKLLGSDGTAEHNQAVLKDMSMFSKSVEKLTTILKQLYELYELDTPPKELY